MAFNGTGVYTLPGAQLINGEIVSASENNEFRNDVATALNTAWTRDGQAPATANIPMGNHKLTGLVAGTEAGDSVRFEQVSSDVDITGGSIDGTPIGATTPSTGKFTDLTVSGTVELTNGTITATNGINVDSDTFVVDSTNNRVGVLTDTPSSPLTVAGFIESTTDGFKFPDGTTQNTAAFFSQPKWNVFSSSGTYVVPDNVSKIRAYAFGAGGDGGGYLANGGGGGGGGGGGAAFGDINVTPGDTLSITISSGIATVSFGATTFLTANKGSNGSTATGTAGAAGGAGGTATKDASVTNGGAYTGGSGGSGGLASGSYEGGGGGGGSSGSPLGNGYTGGNGSAYGSSVNGAGGGGAGIGGNGGNGTSNVNGTFGGNGGGAGGAGANGPSNVSASTGGGGSGGPADGIRPGPGRSLAARFTDPLLADAYFGGIPARFGDVQSVLSQNPGGGGSYTVGSAGAISMIGGDFAGGAGSASGGILGGCGGSGSHLTYGGGGGGSSDIGGGGTGGAALVLIYG